MTATPESRLLCDHCHGHGYEDTAAGKVACGKCQPTSDICSLGTTFEVVDLKTYGVPGTRRELGFAIVHGIKQKACLELIGNVRIVKAVDETLDSHFFRGKSNRCHEGPPKRLNGSESLAVRFNESRDLQDQIGGYRDGMGRSGMAVSAPDYLQTRQFLVNKSICHRLSRVFRQVQTLATVWIPIDCRSDPVDGKCPGPMVSDSCCKYFDHLAFVFQSFHRLLELTSEKLLWAIYPALAKADIEMRQIGRPHQESSEVVSNHQEMSGELQ